MSAILPLKERGWICTACVPLLLLVLLCLVVPVSAAGDSRDGIRLSGVTYLGDLPTLIAEEEGFFASQGLDIDVIRRDSGRDNLKALQAGHTDFALMALSPLVLDRLATIGPSRPNEPVILASLVYSARLNHVVVKRAGRVRQPSDLEGKRVGLMKGTNSEYLWWLFSIYHRLDSSRVTVVDIPAADQPEALMAGEVDALVTWEPWTSRLANRAEGAIQTLAGSELYAENWVLVSTRETASQRADAVLRILQAYRDAIDFIQTHPVQSREKYAEFMDLDPETALRESRLPHFGLNLDWSLLFDLQQMVQWAEKAGKTERFEAPNILSWIEPELMRRLLPLHVGIPSLDLAERAPPP